MIQRRFVSVVLLCSFAGSVYFLWKTSYEKIFHLRNAEVMSNLSETINVLNESNGKSQTEGALQSKQINYYENKTISVNNSDTVAKCNVTFVTALFDLSRQQLAPDKRSWNDFYLKYVKELLLMRVPLVIYTTLETKLVLEEFLLKRDEKNRTLHSKQLRKVFMERDTFALKHTTAKVDFILHKSEFQQKIRDKAYVANTLSTYIPLVYSKFSFLKESIESNPFLTTHFYWIDSGLTRFLTESDTCEEFTLNECDSTRVWVGGSPWGYWQRPKKIASFARLRASIIGTNRPDFRGGFFGGGAQVVLKLHDLVMKEYFEEMLAKNRVDTEQVALYLLWLAHDDLFHVFVEKNRMMEIFAHLRVTENKTCEVVI